MAIYKATARFVRISPSKVKLVIDLVGRRKVQDALNILAFTPKKGARILEKLIKSAVANAQQVDKDANTENLYIQEWRLGPGPTLKRYIPKARGQVGRIRKRTSNITVLLTKI